MNIPTVLEYRVKTTGKGWDLLVTTGLLMITDVMHELVEFTTKPKAPELKLQPTFKGLNASAGLVIYQRKKFVVTIPHTK